MADATDDLRIRQIRPLLSPAILHEEIPLSAEQAAAVAATRRTVAEILRGDDPRLLVVVGPCSIHDVRAALAYADRLADVAPRFADKLYLVMRVYFEKPRTVVGWKGLINDPDLDESFKINKGLRLARQLLVDVVQRGLPAGTEFLDTTFGQFYTDAVSWGAIGARTAESQIHRELASGLSMPVGIKNRTDGDIQVAVDAIRAARHRHLFPSLTKEGAPAILETTGNDDCHLVLRGGSLTGPNYEPEAIRAAAELLRNADLPEVVMVDCSHGNSEKDPQRQAVVARSVAEQRAAGDSIIRGVMLESHLLGGRQNPAESLTFGRSITDPCLSWEETLPVLEMLAR
ncbi:MAG: 3-deoxy-7-phosphoheptulonate synthase [Planctomycetales bacterium]|nr:3-deoxy-7-phosphoheptulonate synthase [Planctomycetales bacterium]